MPGPPPKHPSARARRNNPRKDFTSLPAEGLDGPPPPWPLQPDVGMTASRELGQDRIAALSAKMADATDGRARGRYRRQIEKLEMDVAILALRIEQATDAETALWVELWAMPQAVVWKDSHSHREVAQYVRWKVRAEQGDHKAASEARQLSDRLGLNPLALLRLRLEITRTEEAEERGQKRRGNTPPPKPPEDGDGGDPRLTLVS